MRLKRFAADIWKSHPGALAGDALLMLLTSLLEAATIFLIAPVVDTLLAAPGRAPSVVTLRFVAAAQAVGLGGGLATALGAFLLFSVLRACLQTFAWNMILRTKYRVMTDLTVGTFEDFLNASWRFFSSSSQGTLVNAFTRETNNAGQGFVYLASLISVFLQLAVLTSVPLYISWKVTLASVGVAAAFALPFMRLGRHNYTLAQTITRTSAEMTAVIQEHLSLAKIILSFGEQKRSVNDLTRSYEALAQPIVRCETLLIALPLLYQPFGILIVSVSMLIARRLNVPLSETAVLFYSLFKLIPLIGQITEKKTALDAMLPSYENICELREKARSLRQPTGTRPFRGLTDDIRLENVVFAHPGNPPALDGVTLTIRKGRMTALVGESGAGKSTIADLVLGHYAAQSGKLLLDGTPFSEIDVDSFRRRIGYVSQESLLFNMSVRDNMLWAKEDATQAELDAAYRQANADEFISRLSQGDLTVIGDRGVRLSGGQLQRLALARAVLRKPDLLILDEATSALDTQSERLIQEAIERIGRETTVLAIAHRLSTISRADAIYVLERGRVVEQGTYDELVARGGKFTAMARLQSTEKA